MTTEDCILIDIPGTPRPQPRPRFAKGRVVDVCDPKTKAWEAAVVLAGKRAVANLGAARVKELAGGPGDPLAFHAVFRIPTKEESRWGKWHCAALRYDADNLIKLVMDALVGTKGAPFGYDDARVCSLTVRKVWCKPAEAGCTVRMSLARDLKGGGQT